MKTLAIPCLAAAAILGLGTASATASTLTPSRSYAFDVLVTPRSLSFNTSLFNFLLSPEDTVLRSLFADGSCMDDEFGAMCSATGLPFDDLPRLAAITGGRISSDLQIVPVSGRLTFDGTGGIDCSPLLAPVLMGCPIVAIEGPRSYGQEEFGRVFYEVDQDGFFIDASDGYSAYSTLGTQDGILDTDWDFRFEILGVSLLSTPDFTLTYGVSTRPVPVASIEPVMLPAPVPLPATLPLLLGALGAAGVAARRKRRLSRP